VHIIFLYLAYLFFFVGGFYGIGSFFHRSPQAKEADWFGFYKGSYKATFTETGWRYQKRQLLSLLLMMISFLSYALIELQ